MVMYLCIRNQRKKFSVGQGCNECRVCKYQVPYRRWATYMIAYSVYMMRNPLKPNLPEKAYAKNQVNEIWTLEKFAKHIADHNGVYSRGTVKGVLSDMCECLIEQLLNGNKIQLGELGTFSISISCDPAESADKFTSKNIKSVNILFNPGDDFDNLLSRAEFTLVASRTLQNAAIKAEKNGETTIDIEALKKKPATGGGADNSGKPANPSGGSSSDTGTTVNPDGGAGSEEGDGSEG